MAASMRFLAWTLTVSVLLIAATQARAHKGAGAGPPDAATWVRQVLALLDLKPPDIGEAAERIEGALTAKDPKGVDLAVVREARELLKAKDVEGARAALARALLPPSPPLSQAVDGTPSPGPAPHHADEDVSAHHFPGAPLRAVEPRFTGRPGEYALLAVGGSLIGLGLLALRRAGRH